MRICTKEKDETTKIYSKNRIKVNFALQENRTIREPIVYMYTNAYIQTTAIVSYAMKRPTLPVV